jgi:glycosyltransferase involved in cell wall biosynthesis
MEWNQARWSVAVRVAIVHYWLVGMRGGEKVVEALCGLYPDADLFTNVYDPARLSPAITSHKVRTTFVNRLPFARTLYRWYLPWMPLAIEQLDLRGYDLVISLESGPAKGVIPPLDGLHVCYCFSPMRYAWDMYQDYLEGAGGLTRWAMRPVMHYFRLWDRASADRVDHFLTLSNHTRRRIRKFYRREAEILPPPVETMRFAPSDERGGFYLVAGQLEYYKRADLAVEACKRLGRRLVVIGEGPELRRLRRLGGPNIEFLGWQSDERLAWHYARCTALLFPGIEDFGIAPVECMASGRPVIAYGRGGALEYVIDGVTGIRFAEQTADSLAAAMIRYEAGAGTFDPSRIVEHAATFDREMFCRRFSEAIGRLMAEPR